MKRVHVAGVAALLGLVCAIQYASGGAVMSIDLGSEWMKVNFIVNRQMKFDVNCVVMPREHEWWMFL